jgi:hypothetical protein
MAKSRINPATPATTHNRRESPCSEVNAYTSRKEFRKPTFNAYVAESLAAHNIGRQAEVSRS